MKKIIKNVTLIVLAVIMLAFVGCSSSAPKAKTFSAAGMSIELTDSFHEKELVSATAYYESKDVIVLAIKEEFTLMYGLANYTLADYAQLVINNNRLPDVTVETAENYVHFRYDKEVSGKDFSYWATCFKSDDAFWLIQFACETKNYDGKIATFQKYANSVSFTAEE
jgi:hypothetical protein